MRGTRIPALGLAVLLGLAAGRGEPNVKTHIEVDADGKIQVISVGATMG